MSGIFLVIGVVLAGFIVAGSVQLRSLKLRIAAVGGAVAVMLRRTDLQSPTAGRRAEKAAHPDSAGSRGRKASSHGRL